MEKSFKQGELAISFLLQLLVGVGPMCADALFASAGSMQASLLPVSSILSRAAGPRQDHSADLTVLKHLEPAFLSLRKGRMP